jgi:ketosteroid isomerase-like protein
MDKKQLIALSEKILEAWNTQDVESVAGCYTADVIYRDPNTRGNVNGGDAMRRYLKKLFGVWKMHWALREVYPFSDTEGGAFLWHASIAKAGGEKAIEVDGMDLVLLENGLIKRNDVYFDRAVLAPLMGL